LSGMNMRFTSAFLLIGCVAWAGEPADQPLSAKAKLLFPCGANCQPGLRRRKWRPTPESCTGMDTPREWGQGGAAYGKRVASAREPPPFAMCSLSLWTPPCTRTRGTAARVTAILRADRARRLAKPSSRARTGAAPASRHGDSAARWGRPAFPTSGIRIVSIPSPRNGAGGRHHRPGPAGQHGQRVLAGCETHSVPPSVTAKVISTKGAVT